MIKLKTILSEIPKKTWTNVKPEKYSDDLITIVQNAYKKAPEGSFIRSKSDLKGSNWHSIDIDDNPDIDATIFYRNARSGETWKGNKIQGIGHDGSRPAIDAVLNRLKQLLSKKGNWVEASDAMEHILYKMGVRYIDNEEEAQKVFPNSNLKMTGDRGKYTRELSGGGKKVKETIFGYPKI